MRRILTFLGRPALAFWLLIGSAVVIFWGAVVARLNEQALKQLNNMLFQHWITLYAQRPQLYIWIVILFILLTLLALNTLVCTLPYALQTLKASIPQRRLTIILFHICILIFLLGHLLSTFIGTNASVTLKTGEISYIQSAGISLRLISAERSTVALNNERVPLATAAVLEVTAPGVREVRRLRAFRPAFSQGLSLHLALREKGVPAGAVQIIVRRDYGAIVLMFGACLAMLATVFYALLSWAGTGLKPREGNHDTC